MPKGLFGLPIAEFYAGDRKYFGFYDASENLDILRAVNFISSVVIAHDDTDEESVDIRVILRDNVLTETEKDQLIRALSGQGKFRKGLEANWTNGCPISGHTTPELLRASHIMPWREANNQQRLDPDNVILLCANLDALFDRYLISFSDSGTLLISHNVSAEERHRLGISPDTKISLKEPQMPYLQHHRSKYDKKLLGSNV